MSAPNTPGRAGIEEIIGHQLAQDANPTQYAELEHFANEAAGRYTEGMKRQARDVQREVDKGKLTAGVPALLYRLRKGRHRQQTPEDRATLSKLDRAHHAYLGKLADLHKHNAFEQGWTVEDALAYAIDYTCPGDAEIEAELRNRAGLEPYVVADSIPQEALDAMRRLAAGKPAPPRKPTIIAAVPDQDDDDIPGYGDAA